MLYRFVGWVILIASTLIGVAQAGNDTSVCLAMIADASHNVGLNMRSQDFLDTVYSDYCSADGSARTNHLNAGLNVIFKNVPLKFTLGSGAKSSRVTNFCKSYRSHYDNTASSVSSRTIVVERALQSANECLNIVDKDKTAITYRIMTPNILYISFYIPAGLTLDVRGISHDKTIKCKGSKLSSSGSIQYGIGHGQIITAAAGYYEVTCRRDPVAKQGGTAIYNATALSVDTNLGSLNIFWPNDGILPIDSISEISKDIAAVERRSVPKGMIAFFSTNRCPDGWAAYAAGEGRYVVGIIDGTGIGRQVGKALTSGENRVVGRISFRDVWSQTFSRHAHPNVHMPDGLGTEFNGGTDVGINGMVSRKVTLGTKPGTNAPYIQLLECRKL